APFGECYLARPETGPEATEALEREREKLELLLEKTRRRLADDGFRARAPPAVVREAEEKARELADRLRRIDEHLNPRGSEPRRHDAPHSPKARSARRPAADPPSAPPAIESVALVQGKAAHPALGLGLWGLGRWKTEDEARTKATIARAVERGVRWFDTAEVYGGGRSERVLGDVLARTARADPPFFLATKVSWEHLRPSQLRAALVNSLERLGRPSVDEYLVHAPDDRVPLAQTM
ncbi:Aldo/keto reductase, partial [mine drainage metagenome]